jgi:hypothetical protein
MARGYTVATAALAIQVPVKWVDNILSHYTLPGVVQRRQGVSRKLAIDGLLLLALTAFLTQELGMPVANAIEIAKGLASSGGRYTSPGGFTLSLDVSTFQSDLLERLENAVEIAPAPRRGRPPASKTGRLD